ncbi:17088_t:CDS:2, partial [Cetraspora pellucida]
KLDDNVKRFWELFETPVHFGGLVTSECLRFGWLDLIPNDYYFDLITKRKCRLRNMTIDNSDSVVRIIGQQVALCKDISEDDVLFSGIIDTTKKRLPKRIKKALVEAGLWDAVSKKQSYKLLWDKKIIRDLRNFIRQRLVTKVTPPYPSDLEENYLLDFEAVNEFIKAILAINQNFLYKNKNKSVMESTWKHDIVNDIKRLIFHDINEFAVECSSESTRNRNSRNGPNKKPDLKGYLGLENHNIEVFFAEVSSGPFEPTIVSIKHEEGDYKKLILFSKDAYNYIRENYSSDGFPFLQFTFSSMACIYELDLYAHPLCRWRLFDKIEFSIYDLNPDSLFKTVIGFLKFRQKFKENIKIIEEICINYTSDKEHDQNLEEILSDQELTNEELEDSSSDEDTSGDLTDSSEEL